LLRFILRLFLSFLIIFLFAGEVKSQSRDTIIVYYKNYADYPRQVSTLDSADYVRFVYPPDSSDNLYNISEYYKNGVLKFIGKLDAQSKTNTLLLKGSCVSYYPTGKKQNIAYYEDGKKVDLEYFFRPDGTINYVKKWIAQAWDYSNSELLWKCYDDKGNQICDNGNGQWIIYDAECKNIILRGQIKNGLMDGEWHGFAMSDDSIKYVCKYNKGECISAISYSNGVTYSFSTDKEIPTYRGGDMFKFLYSLKAHLKLPNDVNGRKINIDTVHISFIIEKNGKLTHLEAIGDAGPKLNNALNLAVAKCGDWVPSKYFGVPLRTAVIVSLKIKEGFKYADMYARSIELKGQILDFSKPGDLSFPAK